MDTYRINIFQIVGSEIAVSSEKGNDVFEKIDRALQEDMSVVIDFENIKILTTAFLNSAIGQLYSRYTSDKLKSKLSVSNIFDSDKMLIKKVTDRAKEYFANKSDIDSILKDALNDD
ncbi:MAG: STAS-like domain-containing protein [Bacteroidota bacterium]|nr:STAS-like domain-containing protein [Bacteroidota bacterium]